MPVTVTGTPSIAIRRDAPFGTVSVVMIADTASNQWSARERVARRGQRGDDLLDRQRLHDHAGRKRQHFARRAAQHRRDGGAGGFGRGNAGVAGAGIGVAGVDDQRANRAVDLRDARGRR